MNIAVRPERYRYRIDRIFGLSVLPPIVTAIMALFIAQSFRNHEALASIFLTMFLVPIVLALPFLALSTVTFEMDAAGVSTRLFGLKTQSYSWSGIEKIIKTESIEGRGEYIEIVRNEPVSAISLPNVSGMIKVDQEIIDYVELKKSLNEYIGMFRIPLTQVDEATARSLNTSGERLKAMRGGVPIDKI